MTSPALSIDKKREAWANFNGLDEIPIISSTLEACAKDWFRDHSEFLINNERIPNPFAKASQTEVAGTREHEQLLTAFWIEQFFNKTDPDTLTAEQHRILAYAQQYFYNGGCIDLITPLLKDTFTLQGLIIQNLDGTTSSTHFEIQDSIITITRSLAYNIDNASTINSIGIATNEIPLKFKANSRVTLDFTQDKPLPTVTSDAQLTHMCDNTARYLTDTPREAIEQLQIQRKFIDAKQALNAELNLLEMIRQSLNSQLNSPMAKHNCGAMVLAANTLNHLVQEHSSITNERIECSEKPKHTNADINTIQRLTARAKHPFPRPTPRDRRPQRSRVGWGFLMAVGVILIAAVAIIASPTIVPAAAAVALFVAPKAALFIGGGLLTLVGGGLGFVSATRINTKYATLDAQEARAADEEDKKIAKQKKHFESTKTTVLRSKLATLLQKYAAPQQTREEPEEKKEEAKSTVKTREGPEEQQTIRPQEIQLLSLALASNNLALSLPALNIIILGTFIKSCTEASQAQGIIDILQDGQESVTSENTSTDDTPAVNNPIIPQALTLWSQKKEDLEIESSGLALTSNP